MGQQEVFTFLGKNRNEWFTARQIAQRLKLSYGSVVVNLKRLRQSKEIENKIIRTDSQTPGRGKVFVYRFKK